jgi:hypothetical protein
MIVPMNPISRKACTPKTAAEPNPDLNAVAVKNPNQQRQS